MESEIRIDNAKLLQNDDPSIVKIQESKQQPIGPPPGLESIQPNFMHSPHQNPQSRFLNIFNISPAVPSSLELNPVTQHNTSKTTGTPIDCLLQSKDLMAGSKSLESQDNNSMAQERNGVPKVKSKKSKANKKERKRQKTKDAAEKKSNKCQEAHDNNDEESTTISTTITATTNNHNRTSNNKGGKSGNSKKESAEAETLRKLALDSVFPMSEQEAAATNNRFRCKLCDSVLRDKDVANRHVRSKQHRKTIKDISTRKMLSKLPKALSSAKLSQLQDVLIDQVCHNKDALTCKDRDIRTKLMEHVQRVFNSGKKKDKKPRYKLQLYGSSLHLCGFKDSDLNLNLKIPKGQTAPSTLIHARDLLESSDFIGVNCCFRAKDPHILFIDPKTHIQVRLCVNSESAVYTSRLLWIYTRLDYRLRQLCMVFRTWAHICRLDRQNVGSMPPHAFILMSIFFMQRKRFLPVLPDFINEKDMMMVLNNLNRTNILRSVEGKVLYYPRIRQGSGRDTASPDATGNFEYDWYDSDDEAPLGNSSKHGIDLSARAIAPPSHNVARLWLDMLKFYAFHFDLEELVIDVRNGDKVTRGMLYWAKKRIAVVDPYYTKRNLCKSTNAQVFNYMMNRLQFSAFYFHGRSMQSPRNESDDSEDHIQDLCDDLENLGVSQDGEDMNGEGCVDDKDVEACTATEATVAKNQ